MTMKLANAMRGSRLPEVLPRLIELPAELSDDTTRPVAFAWLEGVIKANIALAVSWQNRARNLWLPRHTRR